MIWILLTVSCGRSPEAALPPVSDEVATEEPSPIFIWVPPYLPEKITSQLNLPYGVNRIEKKDDANLWIDVGTDYIIAKWIYVLVAPFPTIPDAVMINDLRDFWRGKGNTEIPFERLLVSGDTKAIIERLWGTASVTNVQVASPLSLLNQAWEIENTWAIIPFEQIEPRWKVIAINGQSPIDKDFNSVSYPLSIPFSIIGDAETIAIIDREMENQKIDQIIPTTNRFSDRLTTVMVTGVTALTRCTAYLMEKNGMTYPAINIGNSLRTADILHISNEVPFTPTCPNPSCTKEDYANLVFCSKPEYIQLLESIGTDVVELSGDHFRDWGPDAMLTTIEMYEERGWRYYGGGKNIEDGMNPALFEHNSNKIAFLGCNGKPRGYATARKDAPGAVHCDMDLMAEKIQEVVEEGYLPIFTFQHLEYYAYNANKNLINDFQAAADAGAVIVSGSQAHQPHAFQFYKDSFLHYGLGNLFFDQYRESKAQSQALIDEHIFYEGKHISTRLIAIQFIDYARTRLMETGERQGLLGIVFKASNW